MHLTRRLVTLTAGLVLGLGSARAVSAQDFQPTVNGCGAAHGLSRYFTLDWLPFVFDFEAACRRHDACYGNALDRGFCDQRFREDLIASCDNPLCQPFAGIYAWAVEAFGRSAWTESASVALDELLRSVVSCGSDLECKARAAGQQQLTSLIDLLLTCAGDRLCEREVAGYFGSQAPDAPAPSPPDASAPDDLSASFSSCGGVIEGSWRMDSVMQPAAQPQGLSFPECVGSAPRLQQFLNLNVRFEPGGIARFDGVLASDYSPAIFTPACLARMNVALFECSALPSLVGSAVEGTRCGVNAGGNCACTFPLVFGDFAEQQTYSLIGAELLLIPNPDQREADDDEPLELIPRPYCVDGDQLMILDPRDGVLTFSRLQ